MPGIQASPIEWRVRPARAVEQPGIAARGAIIEKFANLTQGVDVFPLSLYKQFETRLLPEGAEGWPQPQSVSQSNEPDQQRRRFTLICEVGS
jgi:hypothetical protein